MLFTALFARNNTPNRYGLPGCRTCRTIWAGQYGRGFGVAAARPAAESRSARTSTPRRLGRSPVSRVSPGVASRERRGSFFGSDCRHPLTRTGDKTGKQRGRGRIPGCRNALCTLCDHFAARFRLICGAGECAKWTDDVPVTVETRFASRPCGCAMDPRSSDCLTPCRGHQLTS